MRVTVFKSFKEIDKPHYNDIQSVIDGIRNGKIKDKIEAIRKEYCSTFNQVSVLRSTTPALVSF